MTAVAERQARRARTVEADKADEPAAEVAEPTEGPSEEPAGAPTLGDVSLVKRGGKVDTGGVRDFATSVRAFADDVSARLDVEVLGPLDGLQKASVNLDAAPALTAASQIPGAVAGVQRALAVLRGAANRLGSTTAG